MLSASYSDTTKCFAFGQVEFQQVSMSCFLPDCSLRKKKDFMVTDLSQYYFSTINYHILLNYVECSSSLKKIP